MICSISDAVRRLDAIRHLIFYVGMTANPSDTLPTTIRYCSADGYNTHTIYNPPDVRWDVLNNIMSPYYLCYYRIYGLNGLPLPKTLWWVVYGWHVVVGGGGREKIGSSTPKSSVITSWTYSAFNSIPVYLPHSTIQKLFKLLKIFRYILDTYQNGSRILSRAINVVSC